MTNLKITSILNPAQWSSFVYDHPNGNIFQTPEMYEVYKNTKNYEPIFIDVIDDNDEILGMLLAVIQKEHSGFLGKFSARSIIMGGPLIKDNNTEVLDFILTEYNKRIKGKAIYTQFRNQWQWKETEKEIFKKHGFIYEPHLDILHDLTLPIENQFMALHKGRRKNIRRTDKQGVFFSEIKNKKEFNKAYELIKSTYKKVKLPMPDKGFFNTSYNELAQKGILKIFVALFDNQIIATRMVLCFNQTIYDWYAGASEKHMDKYPNDFLPWKIIEWGSQNGYRLFDFGGAGKPGVPYGVRDYKMKFGGKLVEFGRFEKVHKPLLMKIGKLGIFIYKILK